MKSLATVFLLSIILTGMSETAKMIEFSWSTPDTAFLRKNIKSMEANTPYDGIGIDLRTTAQINGKTVKCGYDKMSEKITWKYEWFKDAVENLKKTEFKKFTHNFLRTSLAGTSWTDDQYWQILCNNFALMARIAKETGMRGLVVDAEMYTNRFFTYNPEGGISREALYAIARKRGREYGKAIFDKFPDIHLFFWMGWMQACGNKPGKSIGQSYELLLPFLNGLYEVMPKTALFIDGCENSSYASADETDFCFIDWKFRRKIIYGVDPALRKKFLLQTSYAPGLYLDSFFRNDPKKKPLGTAAFRNALFGACLCADTYIWTWGEHGSWWPIRGFEMDKRWRAKFLWEQKCPGVTQSINLIRDPVHNWKESISLLKKYNIPNGDLKAGIKYWEFWKKDKSLGGYTVLKDGIKISDLNLSGCIHRTIKLPAGKLFLAVAKAKTTPLKGKQNLSLGVFWRNGMEWNNPARHYEFEFVPSANGSEQIATGVFRVPSSKSFASLQFGISGQKVGESAVFCDLSLYLLD